MTEKLDKTIQLFNGLKEILKNVRDEQKKEGYEDYYLASVKKISIEIDIDNLDKEHFNKHFSEFIKLLENSEVEYEIIRSEKIYIIKNNY